MGHFAHTMPVGAVIGVDLYYVNWHPFHNHINPYQLAFTPEITEDGYFMAGDWHDTLLIPDKRWGSYQNYIGPLDPAALRGKNYMRVLMQTDSFNGTQIVHCHILQHEDTGMMLATLIEGPAGTVSPAARRIDPTCYRDAADVQPPTLVSEGSCPASYAPYPDLANAFNALYNPAGPPPAPLSPTEATDWEALAIGFIVGFVVLLLLLCLVAGALVLSRKKAPPPPAAKGVDVEIVSSSGA